MGQLSVIYDACVLYPAPLRSFLIYLAMTNIYRARWTDAIHEEWMRNVEKDYPDVTRQQAERIRDLMNQAILDPLVTGYEWRIPALTLPDPDDRHVLAAAIQCSAEVIVTFNLRDFPRELLDPHGIKALHPDAFIIQQLDLSPGLVCRAAKQQRTSLKKPPLSVDEYLASLHGAGITANCGESSRIHQLNLGAGSVGRQNLLGPSPTQEQLTGHSNETQITEKTSPTSLAHAMTMACRWGTARPSRWPYASTRCRSSCTCSRMDRTASGWAPDRSSTRSRPSHRFRPGRPSARPG